VVTEDGKAEIRKRDIADELRNLRCNCENRELPQKITKIAKKHRGRKRLSRWLLGSVDEVLAPGVAAEGVCGVVSGEFESFIRLFFLRK
jgi:hypothetical protein